MEIEKERPVNNSLQNWGRETEFCMKIYLALLIPTIYITHIVQKSHLEQNCSQATMLCLSKLNFEFCNKTFLLFNIYQFIISNDISIMLLSSFCKLIFLNLFL